MNSSAARVIVRYWGLPRPGEQGWKRGTLFCPPVAVRSGHVRDNAMRVQIIEAVKPLVGLR
jgi:hypothetical protein